MVKILSQQNKSVTIIQAVGRVGRKADGKDKGIVYDLIDDFGMYKGWAKKRQNYYRKNSYLCIDI